MQKVELETTTSKVFDVTLSFIREFCCLCMFQFIRSGVLRLIYE